MSVASGRAGQGPGGAPPRSGAGGVLEVTGREPDDLAAGTGARAVPVGVCGCFQFRPRFRVVPVRAVPLAASILRGSPAVAGGDGAGSRQAVRRGQSRGRPRRQSAAAGQNGAATSRPAARSSQPCHLASLTATSPVTRAPRACTPNRTRVSTSAGAPNVAWTRWPPSGRILSCMSGGCRRCAGSSRPPCRAASR